MCGQAPRHGETGKPCTKNGDCQTGICLPTGNGDVCTTGCGAASDCVAGWSCGPLIGQPSNICQCQYTDETCNGKDDDCNGVVDDEPLVDNQCKQQLGSTYACNSGACSCLAQYRCGAACVDTQSDPHNCGACGHACDQGASCAAGQCACSSGPQLVCGGQCVASSTTYHDCGGACAKNSDVATCGSSCTACPTTLHGTATCDGKACGFSCAGGYVPCTTGCCESCATAGCTGLTYCDSTSGLCLPGCSHQSQCDATQGLFCDLYKHTCAQTTTTNSCPAGWTDLGTCSDGNTFCENPDVPQGTTYVYAMACPAGTTARGGYYCSQETYCCVPDN
jgi:hypothetical protein